MERQSLEKLLAFSVSVHVLAGKRARVVCLVAHVDEVLGAVMA